jgi:hypothetical protein
MDRAVNGLRILVKVRVLSSEMTRTISTARAHEWAICTHWLIVPCHRPRIAEEEEEMEVRCVEDKMHKDYKGAMRVESEIVVTKRRARSARGKISARGTYR